MKLERVSPVMAVTNIEETLAFYHDLLSFECVSRTEGWAALRKDEVEIMFTLPNSHEPFEKCVFTGSIYFNTSDVEAQWNALKDKARIVYPIENFYYGMREFAIRDNNGYILQFGQEISDPAQIPAPEMD